MRKTITRRPTTCSTSTSPRSHRIGWEPFLRAAAHGQGRKALYISGGDCLPFLDDLLTAEPGGLYIESSSIDPREFMARAGRDKLYLLKTSNQNIDAGASEDIRAERARLRDLHEEDPGIMMYRGGGEPAPGNAEAFAACYQELLVYE